MEVLNTDTLRGKNRLHMLLMKRFMIDIHAEARTFLQRKSSLVK